MSLKSLPPQEKNFLILWGGGINLAITIACAIVVDWPLLFLIPLMSIVFALLMFGIDSNNPFPPIIFFLSNKIYKYSYNIINLKLGRSTSSNYAISPIPNYSHSRTWYFVCLFPFLLSIMTSKTVGLEVINRGLPLGSDASIIITSVFFIPIFMLVGIALSMVDSSNLSVVTKRRNVLVGEKLSGLLPILTAIQIIYVLISSDKTDFVVNLMRLLTIFALFHTSAILYTIFLEKNYVEKFRKYLTKDGVSMKSQV